MKNILLFLLLLTSFPLVSSATVYYVRDGGGTPTQCTGTTNAVYPGTGIGRACAIIHPAWIFGTPNVTYSGTGPAATSGLIASGDTVYIVGDSDTSPGNQAQYMIGYGMPNTVSSQCSTSNGTGLCFMAAVPSGPNSSSPTKVIGIGTHQPQFWGTQNLGWIVDGSAGGNIDIENIEITQHMSCSKVAPGSGYCPTSYPYGAFAQVGIYLNGSNITTKNLWIHNIAKDAIFFPGNVTNWNSTNDRFIATGNFLTDGGSMTFGGTNNMTNDVWAWGGCVEKYPLPDPGNLKDTANYQYCCDANLCGGAALGGGFVMQYNGNASCGNWNINNSQFLYNLKSNIDLLHCDGTGTFNMYRSRSEGSSGEALKINMQTVNVEESQLIANAPIWNTSPFTAIWGTPYQGGANIQVCRGLASTNFYMTNTSGTNKVNLINDTISGNCTALVETQVNSGACTGASVNAYNTNFVGGYAYDISSNMNLFYNGGQDGNGGGTCGTGILPLNLYYSNSYNNGHDLSDCTSPPGSGVNSHTNCNQDPLILGESTYGSIANFLGPTTYYSGTSLGDQFYLQSSSPLKSAGTTPTYTNPSGNLDYNGNAPTNSPQDIGSVQYGSLIASSTGPTNGFCSISNQCIGATCSSVGYCTGSCTANGTSCSTGATCCSSNCLAGVCSASYTCGDGTITSPEACDTLGPNLNGQTCVSQGYSGGTLGCSSGCLSFNYSSCYNITSRNSNSLNGKCALSGKDKF